jgi:hypothetical protein
MKSILDAATRHEVIARISALDETSKPLWGKMNVYQMLRHCELCEQMYLGEKKYKQVFIGRLFGGMGLKRMLKDDKPMGRNAPTSSAFKVAEADGDVAAEKRKWIELISQYAHFSKNDFVHWFFGKMTREQVGQFVYKHSDHHLRQFGV